MNYEPTIVIGAIIAIGEILKGFNLPAKFLPVINVALGIGAAFMIQSNSSVTAIVISGLIYGLTAAGVYDLGIKPVRNAIKNDSPTPLATPPPSPSE